MLGLKLNHVSKRGHRQNILRNMHYNDVRMSAMAPQITGVSIVCSPFVQTQIKKPIKAPLHWPLWGESIGDRWIPLTKGRWKCFHLMTSPWYMLLCFSSFGDIPCEYMWHACIYPYPLDCFRGFGTIVCKRVYIHKLPIIRIRVVIEGHVHRGFWQPILFKYMVIPITYISHRMFIPLHLWKISISPSNGLAPNRFYFAKIAVIKKTISRKFNYMESTSLCWVIRIQ